LFASANRRFSFALSASRLVSLLYLYHNFCRVHSSLRVTPAMEAGLTDHVWTIAELFA